MSSPPCRPRRASDLPVQIVGSSTRNYLLEKTRVTSPSAGERNFHVFYQVTMCSVHHSAMYDVYGMR